MKTRIYASKRNEVTIQRPDGSSTVYFVQDKPNGGYVRIRDDAQTYPQVCYGLTFHGPTLESTRENLLGLIRREYKKQRGA